MELVLDEHVQASVRLRDALRSTLVVSEPEVWEARDYPDKSIFRADDFLYEAKVVTEGTFVDADPLVRHYWRLFHL